MDSNVNIDNRELVSIIVPVYNLDSYLEECIQSIIIQSYHNIELILVDDGSKDNSADICDDYMQKDSRVVVFHKENEGVSAARNLALDKMRGKYCIFIDGDDWITPGVVEKLYNQIKQTNADIVFANQFCMENDKCIEKIYDYTDKMFFDRKQAIEDYLINSVSMAGRIYKSDLFKNIRFPVGVRMGEDAFALIHILMNVEKTCFCPEEVYYRRIRKGSASRSHFSDSDIEMIGVMEEIADYILNNNFNGKILVGKYMVGKYAEVLLKNAVYANKEVYRQLRKKYKQWYLLSDKMKDEPAAVRMRFALLETSPKLYQTIKRLL